MSPRIPGFCNLWKGQDTVLLTALLWMAVFFNFISKQKGSLFKGLLIWLVDNGNFEYLCFFIHKAIGTICISFPVCCLGGVDLPVGLC
jgi:hypothetical protein